MTIQIGDRVKDNVTGFIGIVIGKATFLNGCDRFQIQSEKLKDGLPTDGVWFDAPQLKLIKTEAVSAGPRTTGGPMPSIPKRQIARR